jgi:hypothetical protein
MSVTTRAPDTLKILGNGNNVLRMMEENIKAL